MPPPEAGRASADSRRSMLDILSASLVSSGGFMASMLLGAVTVKILSTLLGPAGMGLLALLRQIHQTSVTLGSLGGQNTIAQGIASRRERATLGAYALGLVLALLVAGFLLSGGLLLLTPIAGPLLPQAMADQAPGLLRWLVLPILLGLLLVFVNGVLAAWRDVGGLSIAQLADACVMALLAWPVARLVQRGHPGALIGLMSLALCAGLLVGGLRLRFKGYLKELLGSWRASPRLPPLLEFLTFPLGALAVSGVGTATLLAVRSLLSHRLDLAVGGLFDTAWSLSQMYVWILLSSLTTWYLPTLTGLGEASERGILICRFLRYMVGVMTPAAIGLAILKPLVIRLLFTEEFLPALDLWRWLLIGDYLRATSWVLAMTAFARGDMRVYLTAEIAWNLGFFGFAIAAARGGDLEILGPGLLVLQLLYLGGFVAYAARRHAFRPDLGLMLRWTAGLFAALLFAAVCWDDTSASWYKVAVGLPVGLLSLVLGPTRAEWRLIRARLLRSISRGSGQGA